MDNADARVPGSAPSAAGPSANGEVTIDCAPVTGVTSGSLCVWSGPYTAGILFGLGIGMPEAQGLAAEASQAIA